MATDNSVKPAELQQFGGELSKNMLAMQQSMQQSFSKITDVLSRITEEGEIFDDDEERVVEKRPEEMAGDIPVPKKRKAQPESEDDTPAESSKDEGTLHDIAQSLKLEDKCSPKVAEQLAKVALLPPKEKWGGQRSNQLNQNDDKETSISNEHNQQMSAENSGRGGRGDTYSAPLDNTDVVSHALENADQEPNSVTSAREPVYFTDKERLLSPLAQENEISCMSIIRNSLESKGFSHATTNIILSSWRVS
ncbi:hypothetical protein AWC38_SpisGene22466 [Stylophora pistillata]|uniref:Uncharacterized protein n=1 Tax=Stylophora pistillata TaxID=50429 RepID=A0A2B4RAQ4_STYPI|nr:hypothetical protein AWC38_SpisGene22466 [Stylophora pistillata]